MEKFKYLVTVNGVTKAGFTNEIDAIHYKQLMKDINRMAGYRDKYEVKEVQAK